MTWHCQPSPTEHRPQRCPCPGHWHRSGGTRGLSPPRYQHRASQLPPPARAASPPRRGRLLSGPRPRPLPRAPLPPPRPRRTIRTPCGAPAPRLPRALPGTAPHSSGRGPAATPASRRPSPRGHGREVLPPTPHSGGSGRRQGRCRRLKPGQADRAAPAAPGGAGGAGAGRGWRRDGTDAARPRLQPHSPRARWRKRKNLGRAG